MTKIILRASKAFFNYKCPFKLIFGINCPACGLTRSFIEILRFNFIKSLEYNLLGIPLFIFLIFSIIFLIKDIIKKENKYIPKLIFFVGKYYIAIFIILIINMIINNFHF